MTSGSPGEIRTPVDGSLPWFGVQSPSLAGSLFSTLASPLHHRATRDPGLRPRPNKPSAQSTPRLLTMHAAYARRGMRRESLRRRKGTRISLEPDLLVDPSHL